jgi:hypothetical protein
MKGRSMKNVSAAEVISYAGGATSIGASLTMTELGVMVGIVTAILTFIVNLVFTYRKDRREQRESDARLGGHQ